MSRRATPGPARLAALLITLGLVASGCRLPDLTDREPADATLDQTSIVYAADGSVLTTLHAEQDRTLVPIEDIPRHVQDAVVAVEDARFWQHRGVDLKAVLRALYVNATEGAVVEGGSTITQQYVKNVLTGGEETLNRKLREARLAWELERTLSKAEILERYLNTVYFGDGAYGVEAAARHYFSKGARELTLPEAAMLAGLIAAPTDYEPIRHPEKALERRALVLKLMREQGLITPAEERAAGATELGLDVPPEARRYRAAYFVDHVRRLVIADERLGPTQADRERLLYTGGLRIHTTLDPKLQRFAEQAVRQVLPYRQDPYGAMTVIDPRNGHVRAMVGGRDFFSPKDPVAKVNLATAEGAVGRPAGSSFKPFALVAALQKGFPPAKLYPSGSSIAIPLPGGNPPVWPVQNYDGSAFGTISLEQATIHSVNVVYAQLVRDLGGGDPFAGARIVNQVAHDMGIRSKLDDFPSTVLGTNPVNTLEMASAYGSLATMGAHTPPLAITRIESADGRVLARNGPEPVQVVNPGVAWATTEILKKVVVMGTGAAASLPRPVAGKTGTGQQWRDAWFVGYVPQLVASVWVGFPRGAVEMVAPRTRLPHVTGGSWPAQIWHAFMARATAGLPARDFDKPDFGYVTVKIDFTRNCLPNEFTPPQLIREVSFPAGTQPREKCTEPTEPQLLPVPSVVGLDLERAQQELTAGGFTWSLTEEYSSAYPPGTILSQTPGGGEEAYMNSPVLLVVATDVAPSPTATAGVVPDVIGRTRGEAVSALREAGYEVEVLTESQCAAEQDPDCEPDPDRVWTQSPSGGSEAEPGSTVTIWVNPKA